jgi:hypothetical protein
MAKARSAHDRSQAEPFPTPPGQSNPLQPPPDYPPDAPPYTGPKPGEPGYDSDYDPEYRRACGFRWCIAAQANVLPLNSECAACHLNCAVRRRPLDPTLPPFIPPVHNLVRPKPWSPVMVPDWMVPGYQAATPASAAPPSEPRLHDPTNQTKPNPLFPLAAPDSPPQPADARPPAGPAAVASPPPAQSNPIQPGPTSPLPVPASPPQPADARPPSGSGPDRVADEQPTPPPIQSDQIQPPPSSAASPAPAGSATGYRHGLGFRWCAAVQKVISPQPIDCARCPRTCDLRVLPPASSFVGPNHRRSDPIILP